VSECVEGKEKFSDVISEISSKISGESISFEDFLGITGGRGLFMSCMILTAPFLLPVDIPGSSIPFGSAIFLISSDIIFNRPVLIPKRVMGYKISKKDMESILNGISRVLTPLEKRIIAPRLCFLTRGRKMEFINGVMVAFGAVLLVTPIIAPLGDFFPAYGILFVSLGNIENDGFLVLAGYTTIIGTAIYYALIYAVTILVIIDIISYLGHL
jgi:hypothetical protein